MNSEILKSLLGIPTNNSQSSLQQKLKSFISDLGFSNLKYDDTSMYNNHPEFCIFINFQQDTVEAGLPKQVNIYCSLEQNLIDVSYLAKTYDPDGPDLPEFEDLEKLPFSWQALENVILTYQPQTY
jgi:hypothetical protein